MFSLLAVPAALIITGIVRALSTPTQQTPKMTPTQLRQQRTQIREASRLAEYQRAGWTEKPLTAIDVMTGVRFEQYIAGLIREYGCTVAPTKVTGDFGVDLIVNGEWAVQCKRQAKAVGTAAIQQVIAGARMHKCEESRCVVISNQNYTAAAQKMASAHSVLLFGRDNLPDMKEFWTSIAKIKSDGD